MMTTGQMVFMAGAVLLALTVILGIIFLAKRPKYIPDSAAYEESRTSQTQRLLNGYPTDPLTIRRDMRQTIRDKQSDKPDSLENTVAPTETAVLEADSETELLESTCALAEAAVLDGTK